MFLTVETVKGWPGSGDYLGKNCDPKNVDSSHVTF